MSNSNQKKPTHSIPTDAETYGEMVELIAHRRSWKEGRLNSRFPTSEALSGDYVSQASFGLIVCDNQASHQTTNGASASHSNPPIHQTKQSKVLEIINGFHVVDFSEEGMQIQFACDSPLKYSRKNLYLKFGSSLIPVALQWFSENNGIVRAGVSFHGDLKYSPSLAGVLVELSDRLINFLTHRYIADNILQYKEIAVFAYFCILYNLRLRYIHALSMFNRTSRVLKSFVNSDLQTYDIMKLPGNYTYSKYLKLPYARKIVGTQEYKNILDIFIKPYYEGGCSISGAEGRHVFLEEEIVDIVFNFLLFPESEVPHSNAFISQLRSVYKSFTTLQELLPALFHSEKFTQQFKYYSDLITTIILSRDAMIDVISDVGRGQTSSAAADGRLPAQDPGLPDSTFLLFQPPSSLPSAPRSSSRQFPQ